jgi:hypothetical protein
MRWPWSGDSANRVDQVYGLTVLTPVLEGYEEALRERLEGFATGDDSPLARVPHTHVARWVLIPALPFDGPPQPPDSLRAALLLFTSTFDGRLEDYLDVLCERIPEICTAVWGACAGFPGPVAEAPDRFKAYLRRHQVRTGLFYAAYADRRARVANIGFALAQRAALQGIAADAAMLSPPELRSRLEEVPRARQD